MKPTQLTPEKLRRTFYQLALDWTHLHHHMPVPPHPPNARTSNTRSYGHPAEWASDKAADIADIITSWHDLLAEHRNEKPPTRGCEQHRIVAAWKYLDPRCEQLTELVEPEALNELPELHQSIRRALQLDKPRYTLPIPCPNNECGLRTLIRTVHVGQDFIACGACGYTIKETHYPLLIRMTLDAFLAGQYS
jgi:ribosomal protein S27AE